MKSLLMVLMLVSCHFGLAAEVSLVGDETKLVEVKTNPEDYRRKTFVLTGIAKNDDYFNYEYRDREGTFYSIEFRELLKDVENKDRLNDDLGEHCHIYLSRDKGRQIAEVIAEAAPKYKAMRVKVTLLSEQWNMYSVIDVQFPKDGKWSDWIFQGEATVKANKETEVLRAAEKAKEQREAGKKAKDEKERWRTWIVKGKTIEAKFLSITGSKIQLQDKEGTKIKADKTDLGDDDLTWIKNRSRK